MQRFSSMFSPACAVLALALASGCGSTPTLFEGTLGGDGGLGHDIELTQGDGGVTGVPCDVAQVLQTHCLSCHGVPLSGGATVRLDSLDALTAASPTHPGETVGARAVARMQDAQSPMPPGNGVSVPANDLATVAGWVNAGMPAGSCDAAPDAGNPYYTPEVCTSNSTWLYGNAGSSRMNPGQACMACHATEWDAPKFQLAGTVYPTAHEPNNCNGVGYHADTVVITDKNGVQYTQQTNSAGNFYIYPPAGFAPPYTAKVRSADGRERAMAEPQTSGDCNACHTEAGLNGAPGRIMAP